MTDESTANVLWELDSTHPTQAELLRDGLREVIDPELGLSIVELGLIREASMEDEHIVVTMILTTPFCPYGPALMESARSKAEEVTSTPARIQFGVETWEPSMMEGGADAAWGLY